MTPSLSDDSATRAALTLLEGYAGITGASIATIEPGLVRFRPAPDAPTDSLVGGSGTVGGGAGIDIALDLQSALQHEKAHMLVPGSAMFARLIEAVRDRGHRLDAGYVQPSSRAAEVASKPPLPIDGGSVIGVRTSIAWLPVGHLTARVVLRAGPFLEERLVRSPIFDLAAGVPTASRAEDFDTALRSPRTPVEAADVREQMPVDELVQRMLYHLEQRLQPDLEEMRVRTARSLERELERLSTYYGTLEQERSGAGRDADQAMAVLRDDHERRREEERARHRVRAVVHPVQLATWRVLAQDAQWVIAGQRGEEATLHGHRLLVGDAAFLLPCPTCASDDPARVIFCRAGHLACDACGDTCTVCSDIFCSEHGGACHVDLAPTCTDHLRVCRACTRTYCARHTARCAEGDHLACTSCVTPCSTCQRLVCDEHTTHTAAGAPLGTRRICSDCVRVCDGGESVGPDEVEPCTTCERPVCAIHEIRCAVDGGVHCSAHTRRADRSRRFVCDAHRSACAREPDAMFAIDEVDECAVCADVICDLHRSTCGYCVRQVCNTHLGKKGICRTCSKLRPLSDPDNALLRASMIARGQQLGSARAWRQASDATGCVVSMRVSWRRTLVMSVRHGMDEPDRAVLHGLFGKRRLI